MLATAPSRKVASEITFLVLSRGKLRQLGVKEKLILNARSLINLSSPSLQESTLNPPNSEEEKSETTGQEVVNPEDYIKHPLQNSLYNHIQLSSNLISGCDYSLFKDGIEPMWEDERNKRGGRWLITLSKQQRRADLDRFWLETLLCLVGEAFDDHSDDVCGAVVNIRTKGDKLAIWTTDYENKDAITHIGQGWKERLGVPHKVIIGYQSHADTATKSGSTTKNKFVV
ncbi:unnamed protein product [Coregonus sp. 'balchen']|nr:unnamed protein product [Coregonus sp. 'balchen']